MNQHYEALLMDYAAGALDEAASLAVATHMTLSPYARRMVSRCESIGGALLDSACESSEMNQDCLHAVLDRIDAQPQKTEEKTEKTPASHTSYPRTLHCYLDRADISWKKVMSGVEICDLKLSSSSSRAHLIKVGPGRNIPEHSHVGPEITLMLDGSYTDETGTYSRGDLIIMEEEFEHTPVADSKTGCVCLAVTMAPIQLTGWKGKLFNPLVRMKF